MKFWDYTTDEREQWRKDDITNAYVEQLREMKDNAIVTVLDDVRSGEIDAAMRWGGVSDGLLDAIHVAEDVK